MTMVPATSWNNERETMLGSVPALHAGSSVPAGMRPIRDRRIGWHMCEVRSIAPRSQASWVNFPRHFADCRAGRFHPVFL
jgi:hypothetical protein